VLVADTPYGPFKPIPDFTYPGENPAPIFFGNAFYLTNQLTQQVLTTKSLTSGSQWTHFANISHHGFPDNSYHVEDPYMWVDRRKNWHIINHAYSVAQFTDCAASDISAHFFSVNGQNWTFSRQPYSNTVGYDDGSTHTFVTLERPNLHFDTTGQLTHINLAADLVTEGEGCPNRTWNHLHPCPCNDCKWADHTGTTLVVLGV
jgi:hypothetical protein